MRIEQLLYLVEVANCKSMSLAAQNLFTTQPNVSKALKALETELGLDLFARQKNAVCLTKAGEDILAYACGIIDQLHLITAYAQAHHQDAHLQGELKIISPPQIRYMVAEVFSAFHQMQSDVTLSLLIYETSRILDSLHELDADIFFVNINSIDTAAQEAIAGFHSDNYQLSFLFSERLYLYTAADSPLAHKKEISLKELSAIPLGCVRNEYGLSDYLNQILIEKYHCSFPFAFNDSDLLLQKVISGSCSTLVTPTAISAFSQNNGQAIPITENIYKSVYMTTHTDPAKQDLINAFVPLLAPQINHYKLSAAREHARG